MQRTVPFPVKENNHQYFISNVIMTLSSRQLTVERVWKLYLKEICIQINRINNLQSAFLYYYFVPVKLYYKNISWLKEVLKMASKWTSFIGFQTSI